MQKIAAKRKISRLYYLKVSHRRVVRLCSKCLLMGDGQAGSQVSFLMAAQQMLLVSFPAITSTFPTESPPPHYNCSYSGASHCGLGTTQHLMLSQYLDAEPIQNLKSKHHFSI